jgi:hypothetical protein
MEAGRHADAVLKRDRLVVSQYAYGDSRRHAPPHH